MARDKVFLDTSVIIAALLSPRGGSFYILTALKNEYSFVINEYVLEETIRVLDTKFISKSELKSHFFLLLGVSGIYVLPNSSKKDVARLKKVISTEDAPILSSALNSSSYLITLDDEFLKAEVIELSKECGLSVVKPSTFIGFHRSRY